jgi:hypothetical protein
VIHDARAVHDTTTVQLSDYMALGGASWVVAVVSPKPNSGGSTSPRALPENLAAQMNVPKNASAVIVKLGSWKALATSSPTGQPEAGEYAWWEPFGRKRTLTPEDYYSPFAKGGVILFRPVGGAWGIEQFGSVRLLFQGWGEFVRPTFEFVRTHPGAISGGGAGPEEVAQLVQVLSGRNPLLALLVFHHLLTARQLRAGRAQGLLDSSSAEFAAAVTYLLLTTPSADERNHPRAEEVSTFVKGASTAAMLRPVALGAYAVGLFPAGDAVALANTERVLADLCARTKVLGPEAESDPYLSLVFEKMGVPH